MFQFDEREINKKWIKFIDFTIPVLDNLNSLTKTLFNRYYDEFTKDLESNSEAESESDLIAKIKQILILIFENTLVIDQYLNFATRECNSIHNTNYLGFLVNNEMNKQFIGELFFTTKIPKEALIDISHIMVVQYKVNQFERILKNIENYDDLKKDNFGLITSAYKIKSEYFLFDIDNHFTKICDNWWWYDKIVMASIFTQAKIHLNSLNELMIQNNERMHVQDKISIHLSLAMSKEVYHKSKYYYSQGVKAAEKGIHTQSIKYFEIVLKNGDIGRAYLTNKTDENILKLKDDFDKLIAKTKLIKKVAKLTAKFNIISKNILMEDKTGIMQTISEIKQITADYYAEIEIKYLSALPDLFSALSSTIELLLSMGKEVNELSEELNQRLQHFNSRLDVATSQLIRELENLNQVDNISETKIQVTRLLKDINILLETSSLIPKNIIERISTIKKLQTLKSLTTSIYEDLKAFEYKDSNNILTLIHKAKANYHASYAINLLSEQKSNGLPIERIYAQYTGSLISGYQKEIEIYQLNIQFICINDILPRFLLFLTQQNINIQLESLKNELWNDQNFTMMLHQIESDCNKLIKHKNNNFSVNLSGIHWENISNKKYLISGIILFYKSIKYAILGSIASINEEFDDAIQHFMQAQDAAFSASSPMKEISNNILNEYSSHIFSFGQFCQDSSNKIRDKNKIRLPVQEVIKLFRDMIFNL